MCPRPLPGDAGAKPPADDRSEPGESAENAAARATNLRVAYAFTLLAGVARGVWSYSVLSGYLYVLTGDSNFKVGLAEGAQGISQAAVSLSAGWAADRYRRDAVCRAAACLGVVASLGLACAASIGGLARDARFGFLTASLALFGAYQGVWTTALETIFADSTHRGERRAAATTRKFVLTLAATCAGPLIAIALFEGFGDAWTLPELRIVLAAGVALCAPPALLLLKLRDVRSPDDVADDDPGAGAGKPRRSPLGAPRYVILASDLVSGFGSGMTVKFVPLFFKNRVGFSPVATNALYVASPLFMMAGSRACGRLSREALGRPRACAYFMGLAALGLVGLSLLDSSTADGLGAGFPREPDRGAPGRPLASAKMRAAAVALYLLTNAQHMCRPLKKSALMDHVPYGDRGKWNAVDGVTRFGWSGSAVLGGYLVDRGGYALTFLITAGMQLLAAALWLALVGVVDPSAPGARALCARTGDAASDDESDAGGDDGPPAPRASGHPAPGDLDAPLLARPGVRRAPGSPRHRSYEEHLRSDSLESESYLSDYSEMPV